jgi:hypothetical protein
MEATPKNTHIMQAAEKVLILSASFCESLARFLWSLFIFHKCSTTSANITFVYFDSPFIEFEPSNRSWN